MNWSKKESYKEKQNNKDKKKNYKEYFEEKNLWGQK